MMDELKKLPPPSPVEEPINNRGNTKGRRKQQMTQQQQPVSFSLDFKNSKFENPLEIHF